MIVNLDVEDVCTKTKNQRKTLRKSSKTPKKQLSTENQNNTKYRKNKLSGDLHFIFILPGGRFAPLSPVSYPCPPSPLPPATNHRRLLFHTEVRWLSKGNCLKIFMELFEPLSEFLKDKSEMILALLMTTDGKVYVIYLSGIFEKVCSSHKQLQ